MKIEYKNPEWIENRINELEYRLEKIQEEYSVKTEEIPVIPRQRRNFEDDYRVQMIRKQITYCLSVSIPAIIVTMESEGDEKNLKELQERIMLNENNL